jgi:sigma-70-like protein
VATLDQLAAEQRAIIELVVQRGRSYEDLAGMLSMPNQRVRQLAREALIELAPVSAKRVEAERRGQLADFVLGQQSSAEQIATQTHLRRSEAGRAWTSSLVDSLAGLYPDEPPEIPEGEVEPPPRRRERERDRPRERERRPMRERAERAPLRERGDRAERRPLREKPRRERRPRREPRQRPVLSPEAQVAVRRRRLAGLGAVLLIAGIVAGILIIAGGGDDKKKAKAAPAQFRVLGELLLEPLEGVPDTNQGIAIVGSRGKRPELVVQAKLTPTRQRQAYGVWLYNSRTDALSLGAQVTDQNGNYVGRGALPADYRKYRYIDISTQVIPDPECARNPTCLREVQAHSGKSVLRGALADMRGPNQAVPGQTAPPGTTTAP